MLTEQQSVHIMTPFGAKSLYCDSLPQLAHQIHPRFRDSLPQSTCLHSYTTHVLICHYRSAHLQLTLGGEGAVCCRAGGPNTKDAVHAPHLIHFAMAGEAISDTVPRAGAVSSARARVLAEPKWTTASVVLARKAKGLHRGASPTI